MAIFGPKPRSSPFGNIFNFYSLENCFFVLEYHKAHFPGLYRRKKYDGNMANFRPKPRTNPFKKI